MSDNFKNLFLLAVTIACILFAAVVVISIAYLRQKRKWTEHIKQQDQESERQKKMLRLALESQEIERKRISKEIHDEVGVMLQALRTTAQALASNAPANDKQELQEMVNELTNTVRHISWDLMPSTLERFGLTIALEELVNKTVARNGMKVTFVQEGLPNEIDIHQQLLLYRIAQEAISNATVHSEGSSVEIKINWTPTDLYLTISDNGIGFDFLSRNDRWRNLGLGINNMESRAKLLNAQLIFLKNEPSGSTVQLKLPLNV